MHLAPPSAIGVNAEFTTRYKMDAERTRVRSFATSGVPARLGTPEKVVSLPLGTEFEYLDADSKTYRPFSINNIEHAMIRCKLLTNNSEFVDKEVWIASGNGVASDTERFNFLNKAGSHLALATPEPAWMTGSDIKRDGSVVAIKKPTGEDTRISVQAGDALGYLSLSQHSQDSQYVVHIEMFSLDKPEDYFLNQFENINHTPIDGSASNGAIIPGNAFFEKLVTLTAVEGEAAAAVTTTEALVTRLNARRAKLENLIVQHQSEWYQQSAIQMVDAICTAAIGVMDNRCVHSYPDRPTYDNSRWRSEQIARFNTFSAHQKSRAELLSWIQDAGDIIPANPKPYYFWPMKPLLGCLCHRDISVKELKSIVTRLREHEHISSQALFYSESDLPERDKTYERLTEELNTVFKTYNIDTCIQKIHFLAQIYHESDRFRSTKEVGGSQKSYAPYFGRGLIQLTHKSNYEKYSIFSGNNVLDNLSLASNDLSVVVDSAGWFWDQGKELSLSSFWQPPLMSSIEQYHDSITIRKTKVVLTKTNGDTIKYGTFSLNKIADLDNIYVLTFLINGGNNGLAERMSYVNELKEFLSYEHCPNH